MTSAQGWGPSSTRYMGKCAVAGGIVAGAVGTLLKQPCPPWAPWPWASGGCCVSVPSLGSVPVRGGRRVMETQ